MLKQTVAVMVISLIATEANAERYSVSLTRKESNFYQVDGQQIFVRTKYCYEYGYSEEAIIDTNKREVYFLGSTPAKCDLDMLLKQIGYPD